jgi:CubicO group peptidase (beta-lactamase class C family)
MRNSLIALSLLPSLAHAQAAQVRIDFDARRVTAVTASGIADKATARQVTADDPVRMASISKLVVAMGVMKMVEAGQLDLDADVSVQLGWRLRNPAFPDVPINLRMLLSHQSSLTDGADYLVPLGEDLKARMANPKAWDAEHAPGTYFRYTNLNFPVVASVMEMASGERFDRLMQRLVLKPLRIAGCFGWATCTPARIKRAVVLYDVSGPVRADDLKGKAPPCPVFKTAVSTCDLAAYKIGSNGALFSPQGGLRISARDLAKVGQVMLRGGRGFLKPASTATLTTPAWVFNGSNGDSEKGFFCHYALAVQTIGSKQAGCNDEPFGDGRTRYGHAGEAYGLRSGLWLDRATGKGTVFFVTAVPDDEPRGQSAFYRAEEVILRGRINKK